MAPCCEMSGPLLVFTTDFGLTDSYTGVMKGVALGINPDLRFIDLTHQIAPQNVAQGAFALGVSYRYFPSNAIHVAVVDPGVGTSRRPILLQTPHGSFVAPDNGLLSRVLSDYLPDPSTSLETVEVPPVLRAFHLTNPDYWRHPVSSTFHGRDVFTPVAAHLSLGVAPEVSGRANDGANMAAACALPPYSGGSRRRDHLLRRIRQPDKQHPGKPAGRG